MTPEQVIEASQNSEELDRLNSLKAEGVDQIINDFRRTVAEEIFPYLDLPKEEISEYFLGLEPIITGYLDKKIYNIKMKLQELGVDILLEDSEQQKDNNLPDLDLGLSEQAKAHLEVLLDEGMETEETINAKFWIKIPAQLWDKSFIIQDNVAKQIINYLHCLDGKFQYQDNVAQASSPRVSPEEINHLLSKVTYEFTKVGCKGTLCSAFLGDFMIEQAYSASVCVENYNAELGEQYSKEACVIKVKDTLWELMGFALFKSLNSNLFLC